MILSHLTYIHIKGRSWGDSHRMAWLLPTYCGVYAAETHLNPFAYSGIPPGESGRGKVSVMAPFPTPFKNVSMFRRQRNSDYTTRAWTDAILLSKQRWGMFLFYFFSCANLFNAYHKVEHTCFIITLGFPELRFYCMTGEGGPYVRTSNSTSWAITQC